MINLVIGIIFDAICAAIGILALFLAGRCAHGRVAVRAAGVALVLYALIAIPWRLWFEFGYLPALNADPGTTETSIMRLYEVLAPVRSISGSLLVTAAAALLITALVIRGRREFARPQPSGPQPGAPYGGVPYAAAQHGGAYGAPGQHQQQRWPAPHGAAPQGQRPAPGPWAPPPGSGQSPPHGAPPPEAPEGGAR